MDLWLWNLNNDIRLIHTWVWPFKPSCCSSPDYIICPRALLCSYWDEWRDSKPFGLTLLSKRHQGGCLFNILYKSCGTASHSSWTDTTRTTHKRQAIKMKVKMQEGSYQCLLPSHTTPSQNQLPHHLSRKGGGHITKKKLLWHVSERLKF